MLFFFGDVFLTKKPRSETTLAKRPFVFNTYTLPSWDKQVFNVIIKTNGAWCAGGAALALYTNKPEQINDWDVFVESTKVKRNVECELHALGFHSARAEGFLTEWEKSASNPCRVQVIEKYGLSGKDFINQIFESFDISVCKVGFHDAESFYIDENVVNDIENKIFRLHMETLKTNVRINKYKNKGYVFDEDSRMTAKKGKILY
jgi:hypothetical protein